MISGAWMYPREDEAVLKICWEPRHSDKPCSDSERAQRWRMSLASLLFFTVLLSDHLWLVSAGAKARSSFSFSLQPAPRGGDQANYSSLVPLQSFPGGEGRGCWDNLLSNLTKSAAHSPHCTGARTSHLDSACTKLHYLQRHRGSLFPPSPQTSSSPSSYPWSSHPFSFSSKRNFLKAYFRNLTLSFCNTYTLLDLLLGMPNPDSLNCSLEKLMEDFPGAAAASNALLEGEVCSSCVQAYQRLDQHAQEKYEEFDFVLEKYLQAGEYSVRSCVGDCKAVYKAWLCSEYFNVTQRQCRHHIPCKQYCLEVQTRCPFMLPDNDDLIYGGLPGFICTDTLEDHISNTEAECCDVRWHSCNTPGSGNHNSSTKSSNSQSMYYQHRSRHHQHHHRHHHLHPYYHNHNPSLLPVSAGTRLGNTRLRLCVLVLMLLHTMASFSAVQNGVSLEPMTGMEETSAREE
ncbi:transmembrane FAM155B [Pelobates cultripes]|uniref:Transmembrane FAM155B n=2 Tax=Pelobates cultripes TaxID=61616 RepID=A0AAD1T577_PELCU|nr:transmembrane FAM155B [Pelobates cultripes]